MEWFYALDVDLFRCINNLAERNGLMDGVMKFCAGNKLFVPMLIAIAILAIWKGGRRGRVCLFVSIVLLSLGDPFIWNTIKHAVHRPRPCVQFDDVHLLVGCSNSGSMPSAHAANWFVAVAVLFFYYRRSI